MRSELLDFGGLVGLPICPGKVSKSVRRSRGKPCLHLVLHIALGRHLHEAYICSLQTSVRNTCCSGTNQGFGTECYSRQWQNPVPNARSLGLCSDCVLLTILWASVSASVKWEDVTKWSSTVMPELTFSGRSYIGVLRVGAWCSGGEKHCNMTSKVTRSDWNERNN